MKLKKVLGITAGIVAGKVISDIIIKKLNEKAAGEEDYDYCDECKHEAECEHTSENCCKHAENDEDIVTKAAESLDDADIEADEDNKKSDEDDFTESEKMSEMTDEEAEEAIKQLVDEHNKLDDGEKPHTKLDDLSDDEKAALKAELIQEIKSKFSRDELRKDLLGAIDVLDTKVTAAIPVAEDAINKAINKATEISKDAADAGKQFVADHPELKKYIDTSIDTIKNTVDANFGTESPEEKTDEDNKEHDDSAE